MLCLKWGSADTSLHGGPKCRIQFKCWADNIVVTVAAAIADEDKHGKHDDNIDHNDRVESQMIE